MILDTLTEFASAVTVNAAAGTANIGSTIDMGAGFGDAGNGQPIYLVIQTTTEIVTAGNAGTLQFKLVSDSTATPETDTTVTTHMLTNAFVTDGTDANDPEMKAGGVIFFGALPLEGNPYEQFIGIQAVTATTTTTAGAIDAFLTLDPHGWKSYPDASN